MYFVIRQETRETKTARKLFLAGKFKKSLSYRKETKTLDLIFSFLLSILFLLMTDIFVHETRETQTARNYVILAGKFKIKRVSLALLRSPVYNFGR